MTTMQRMEGDLWDEDCEFEGYRRQHGDTELGSEEEEGWGDELELRVG